MANAKPDTKRGIRHDYGKPLGYMTKGHTVGLAGSLAAWHKTRDNDLTEAGKYHVSEKITDRAV